MYKDDISGRLFSYHVFLFPFKWEMNGRENMSFAERTSIKDFKLSIGNSWQNIATPITERYKRELFNEKNFFYKFAHPALYDIDNDGNTKEDNIIQHFERRETYEQEVFYKIHVVAGREDIYRLKLKSISLNLYGTGVGILMFYLENNQYSELADVLRINQFGRRIAPPFFDAKEGIAGTKKYELAESISIEGLNGDPSSFFEDFSVYTTNDDSLFEPARFIKNLISDFSEEMKIASVIDDRMFVTCWYGNNSLSRRLTNNITKFELQDDWYKFLFIDGGYATCQNDALRKKLIEHHTYHRWQKVGTLYGCSRYSMVFLSQLCPPEFLITNFRTIYTRMAELSLVQRASVLNFSDEVAAISSDRKKGGIVHLISELYRKYIHFVNKIYFREITPQEQGIEIYDLLQKVMKVKEQVKALDDEIGELHNYLTILEDKERNTNIELLTIISSVIIIPTLIVAFVSMPHDKSYWWLPVIFILLSVATVYSIKYKKNEKNKLMLIYIIFLIVFVILFFLSPKF